MLKKILNPFPSLPLRQALCWGIVALILSAIFCWQVRLRVTSLTQVNYAGGSLASATLQQVVVWLLFVVVLYVAALIFSREKVSFVDVAAYNLFARIPFDVMLLIFAIPMVRSVTGLVMDGSMATASEYATTLLLIGVAFLHTLGSLCLRINDNLLCFGLCMNHIGLLTKFGFCNISVLTEMQFFEFFVRFICHFFSLSKPSLRENKPLVHNILFYHIVKNMYIKVF